MAREPRSVVHDGDRPSRRSGPYTTASKPRPATSPLAWARLQPRRQRRRRVWPLLLLGATAGAGAIAGVLVLRAEGPRAAGASVDCHRPRSRRAGGGTAACAGGARHRQLGAARQAARTPSRRRARPLVGELSPAGHLVLESGTLEVDAPAPIEVRVGSLRVDGSAGRFKVSRGPAGSIWRWTRAKWRCGRRRGGWPWWWPGSAGAGRPETTTDDPEPGRGPLRPGRRNARTALPRRQPRRATNGSARRRRR